MSHEINVNDSNFDQEVLKADMPVLVDFWAEWCGPCRMIMPVIEEIAKEYSGKLKVCKVNVDESPRSAAKYGVMSIPTIAVFMKGEMKERIVGAVPKASIVAKISAHI